MSSKPRWPGRGLAMLVLLAVLAAAGPLAAAQTTSNTNGHPPSADSTPAASTAKPDSATTSGKTPENNAALAEKIAKLPPLTGTGIDVSRRSAEILAHLNAVLRFYRAAVTPIQKAGEPSDVLYAQQSRAQATEITQLAFQAAKNEAALLDKVAGKTAAPADTPSDDSAQARGDAEHLGALQARAAQRISALQAQDATLSQQIASARGKQLAALQQQQSQVEGQLELQQAMSAAVARITSFSAAQVQTGLAGKIDRLEQSAPELTSTGAKPPAPPVLESLATARQSGVASQAVVLFQLLSTYHTIDNQVRALDDLRKQAEDLRTPVLKILRSTMAQGQALAEPNAEPGAAAAAGPAGQTTAQALAATRRQFDQLTTTFEVISRASLPLSQEVVLLQTARGTLTTWQATVNEEYKSILRDLLLRVFFIAIALGILALASKLWSRATVRYVTDLRRRRQLLFVRRAVIGFLSGLVILFGFVTQFSSLATFAGFISAGIAVGLQSILLSVAAYFFIVGRYGVRVGDRITVANVTGDVIEVGLVRFYMIELVGTGTELHSTGRVAVFANSILFQTGTPIYKQMPGTEYAWHELIAKLTAAADVPATTAAITEVVNRVYAGYSAQIQGQHQQVEAWIGTAVPEPKVESRLELAAGGLQFAVLFPVQIDNAAATDQQIAEDLVKAMQPEGPLKTGLPELPVIKAAVKT